MRVIVKKWGNSASVRIPVGIMQAVNLSLDETVGARPEGGRIVIEPASPGSATSRDCSQALAKKHAYRS